MPLLVHQPHPAPAPPSQNGRVRTSCARQRSACQSLRAVVTALRRGARPSLSPGGPSCDTFHPIQPNDQCLARMGSAGRRILRAGRMRSPGHAGLTILEMLVSTALLTVIVLGLTAMLIQTQNAFKTGTKQATSTDAGRAIIDMIASDLAQMTDPHFTNVYNPFTNNPTSFYYYPTNLVWSAVPAYDMVQYQNGVVFRTNQLQDIFILLQTNNIWFGIGYSVSNWFTNASGGSMPGVGTLYRYTTNMTGPLTNNNELYHNFLFSLANNFSNFHRVADGVVDLKINPYDATGNPDPLFYGYGPFSYPTVITNYGGLTYQTNYLPHSVDVEIGILEPEAFEHARALYQSGATIAAGNYLTNAAGQVEIFRQHIVIPGAP